MSGFGQIAVVGLGLLGGSVALGARQRGLAGRSGGATRNPQAREQALASGSVDGIQPLAERLRACATPATLPRGSVCEPGGRLGLQI